MQDARGGPPGSAETGQQSFNQGNFYRGKGKKLEIIIMTPIKKKK